MSYFRSVAAIIPRTLNSSASSFNSLCRVAHSARSLSLRNGVEQLLEIVAVAFKPRQNPRNLYFSHPFVSVTEKIKGGLYGLNIWWL
ncbi:MAG: hypothetical protein CMF59_17195 [Leptospiraceae bacterium]|nr:hypothetical protein [Leptospiraceae bacterium]